MAELVDTENREQREGERQPGEQRRDDVAAAEGPERGRREEERARGQRAEAGQHEEDDVDADALALDRLHQRQRLQHHLARLGAEERREAERAEARDQPFDRLGRRHQEMAAIGDERTEHAAVAHREHVPYRTVEQVLGHDQIVGGRRERSAGTPPRPEAHEVSLPRGQVRDGPPHRIESGLHVHRTQQRLQRGGQDRLAGGAAGGRFAASQSHEPADVERSRPASQLGARDQLGSSRREHADRRGRIVSAQSLGDDQAERGVADEGQRFVVIEQRVLVGVRRVGQRAGQEIGITEAVRETLLELGEARRVHRDEATLDTF